MRRAACLALVSLMILAVVPAGAASGPTELQFMYRYVSMLNISGITTTSDRAPVTEFGAYDSRRITSFDNCKIVALSEDNIVYLAAVYSPEENVDTDRAICMLMALNPDYKFGDGTDTIGKIEAQAALDAVLSGNEATYCGYRLLVKTEDGLTYIAASNAED